MRCLPAHHFTVAKARSWRSAIDDEPDYQRGGDAWNLGQRQRFIDSLLNGYDVPKIYLHDLRGLHPTKVYAVVDGKQRLTAIWTYLDDGFPLADDFRLEAAPPEEVPEAAARPAGSTRFSALDPAWQRALLGTYLSVVLIRDADADDIDRLFARLNDGSPLTAGELRNAIVGDMAALVREVAARPALADILRFPDARAAYREVAAALLTLEWARIGDEDAAPATADLGPSGLDDFVRRHRHLHPERRAALLGGIDERFAALGPELPPLADPAGAVALLAAAWDRAGRRDLDLQAGAVQRSKRTG